MIHHQKVDINTLSLTPKLIFREMGYGKVAPKADLVTLVTQMLEEVKELSSPSFMFKVEQGRMCAETVVLDNGGLFHVGPILGGLLVGSERFSLFTATAGDAFHLYQKKFDPQEDILRCFVADSIGTLLVEAVGDSMETYLKKEIMHDKHTRRFSPGYCGWSLMEQRDLFNQLGGTPCGIKLSDVCLMTPEKSISGIIGIGSEVNEKTYGCRYCNLETCYKRKKRNTTYE